MYEIEQYEIWTQKYRIEAATEGEAIKKLFAGKAEAMDNALEFIEIADDLGMPVEEETRIWPMSFGRSVLWSASA